MSPESKASARKKEKGASPDGTTTPAFGVRGLCPHWSSGTGTFPSSMSIQFSFAMTLKSVAAKSIHPLHTSIELGGTTSLIFCGTKVDGVRMKEITLSARGSTIPDGAELPSSDTAWASSSCNLSFATLAERNCRSISTR
jgi:hypothetical protein